MSHEVVVYIIHHLTVLMCSSTAYSSRYTYLLCLIARNETWSSKATWLLAQQRKHFILSSDHMDASFLMTHACSKDNLIKHL